MDLKDSIMCAAIIEAVTSNEGEKISIYRARNIWYIEIGGPTGLLVNGFSLPEALQSALHSMALSALEN